MVVCRFGLYSVFNSTSIRCENDRMTVSFDVLSSIKKAIGSANRCSIIAIHEAHQTGRLQTHCDNQNVFYEKAALHCTISLRAVLAVVQTTLVVLQGTIDLRYYAFHFI